MIHYRIDALASGWKSKSFTLNYNDAMNFVVEGNTRPSLYFVDGLCLTVTFARFFT